jgi:hypothetical protein
MSQVINQLKRLSTFASHHKDPRPRWSPSTFRLSTLGLLLTFSLLTIQCGLDIEDPTPPSAPIWVQKSLPEEWPERGIDAHESGGIYLEWEQNFQESIVAYLIYRAEYFDYNDSLSDFELLILLNMTSQFETMYIDKNVVVRKQYAYKVESEDVSDNKSAFSDAMYYSLLPQIQSEMMIPNSLSDTLKSGKTLIWRYYYLNEMEDYHLTLLDSKGELLLRAIIQPTNYFNGEESWQLPDSIDLETNVAYKWRIDASASYENGLESAGSESSWAHFVYIEG